MQFTAAFKELIRGDRIDVTFRYWRMPRVRVDGTYRIAPDLAIRVIDLAVVSRISDADAQRAGFPAADALRDYLTRARTNADAALYRVAFERIAAPADSRSRLAVQAPDDSELAMLSRRLTAMDARSTTGAWTRRVLADIDAAPGVRAGDLADAIGWETPRFKVHVRRLRALGLTHSLEAGYRISLRGRSLLAATDDDWQMRPQRRTP